MRGIGHAGRRIRTTVPYMEIGVRELRDEAARVIAAVESGERVVLTVRGRRWPTSSLTRGAPEGCRGSRFESSSATSLRTRRWGQS